MLAMLSMGAKATAVLLALVACIFGLQAVPETSRVHAGRQVVESCNAVRDALATRIPPGYPEWRRERMVQELPDCGTLPRPVWRTRRAAASAYLFIGAFLAASFVFVLREVERAAEAPEA